MTQLDSLRWGVHEAVGLSREWFMSVYELSAMFDGKTLVESPENEQQNHVKTIHDMAVKIYPRHLLRNTNEAQICSVLHASNGCGINTCEHNPLGTSIHLPAILALTRGSDPVGMTRY